MAFKTSFLASRLSFQCIFLCVDVVFFMSFPLYSQYILSVSTHVVQNKHLYVTNQEIHNIGTIYKTNLHPPISNTNKYQKGPYYSGIKFFNHLPENIRELSSNMVLFRSALKGFLYENSFCSIREFLNYTWLFKFVKLFQFVDCTMCILCV
jgi:hypothetical protein